MKVKFVGYMTDEEIKDPWFTVDNLYDVIESNPKYSKTIWVTDDTGSKEPMFASEYEIVEA